MQLQQEKQIAKSNLLRKCGLLAHTSAAFLKNCCTEKLFGCLRLVIGNTSLRFLFHLTVQFHLLRKCGLLAHTSAAFLKNCCTEKLFSSCNGYCGTWFLGKIIAYGSADSLRCLPLCCSPEVVLSELLFNLSLILVLLNFFCF